MADEKDVAPAKSESTSTASSGAKPAAAAPAEKSGAESAPDKAPLATAGLAPTNAEVGEGATTVVGGDRDARTDDLAAANQHIEVIADPEGKVSNRVEGTIQSEPTPEEMPADAKIAPVYEQVNPNAAAQAVGSLPQPATIAGVDQPKEGAKSVPADGDTADVSQYLPE